MDDRDRHLAGHRVLHRAGDHRDRRRGADHLGQRTRRGEGHRAARGRRRAVHEHAPREAGLPPVADRRGRRQEPDRARALRAPLSGDQRPQAPELVVEVVARAVRRVDVPVAAYNVSGEYAMVEAAAAQGWINRDAAIVETLTSLRRAGADVVLTYWALEYAGRLHS